MYEWSLEIFVCGEFLRFPCTILYAESRIEQPNIKKVQKFHWHELYTKTNNHQSAHLHADTRRSAQFKYVLFSFTNTARDHIGNGKMYCGFFLKLNRFSSATSLAFTVCTLFFAIMNFYFKCICVQTCGIFL